jgi:serine protease Do/serine protease DegQ
MPTRFAAIAAALLIGLLTLGRPAVAQPSATAPVDSRGIPTLAPILKTITPGVVNIAVEGRIRSEDNPLYRDPFFRRFFGAPEKPPEREFQSTGSGVIVDAAKGYVLTNNHVIQQADRINVGLLDGRRLPAKILGADPEADIAILQIAPQNLTAVPLGDSDQLEIGDFVIAIGNPFGLGQTVTSGIISALERSGLGIEGLEDFIQTDAPINPGNSGGALVDLRGRLIGINTAIVGPAGGNVGIGFAIPINAAREIMEQIHRYGSVRRGQLGVLVQDPPVEIANAMAAKGRRGAVVVEVMKGSAAEKAGIRSGDVVLAVNGRPVRSATQLRNRIALLRAGQKVNLQVLRDDEVRTLSATVGSRAQ